MIKNVKLKFSKIKDGLLSTRPPHIFFLFLDKYLTLFNGFISEINQYKLSLIVTLVQMPALLQVYDDIQTELSEKTAALKVNFARDNIDISSGLSFL